jgi:transposase
MASLTKKVIRGQIYYYARECKRVDGKPKIVSQKYLGRLDDIISAVDKKDRLLALPQPQREGLVLDLGAVAALYDLANRLNLASIIDRYVPKRGKGPSTGTYLLVAIINRCVDPRSKSQIGEWFDKTILRRLIDIKSHQLTSQRYWDNMDRLSAEAIGAIESDLTAHMVKEFELDVRRVLFDATNFFTFIDSFNDNSTLAQRGKNKEGRTSLRIVGLALLVTADFHVPLFHHTYPGNHTDAPTFAGLTDQLVTRCKRLVDGVEDVTLVFDKGNNSQENIDDIDASPYHFVGSLVPTHHLDLLQIPRSQLQSLAEDGLPTVFAYRTTKKVFGRERTVLVTYNDNLCIAQTKTLLREIAKRHQRLRELSSQLDRWRNGQLSRGQKPTLDATQKKVKVWLKARHMAELFTITVTERDGLPDVVYHFNENAWANLQTTLLGKTLLFTDNDTWSDADIVRAYRSQYHVEEAFRTIKSPHHIAIRPQYHWTDQKIRVHVFTCVVALMLLSLLRRELHHKGITLSIRKILECLTDIRELTQFFIVDEGQGKPIARTSVNIPTAQQKEIFQALNLDRYTAS